MLMQAIPFAAKTLARTPIKIEFSKEYYIRALINATKDMSSYYTFRLYSIIAEDYLESAKKLAPQLLMYINKAIEQLSTQQVEGLSDLLEGKATISPL